jgi:hypothetical protein
MREKAINRPRRCIQLGVLALAIAVLIGAHVALISGPSIAQTPSRWGWRNFHFGQFARECPTWRYELSAQPDGIIELHLIQPATHQIRSQGQGADRSYELLIGQPPCQFRVKIERSR